MPPLTPRQMQPVTLRRWYTPFLFSSCQPWTLRAFTRKVCGAPHGHLFPRVFPTPPGGLTRLEKVSLRDVRVNVATTPVVRASWGYTTTSTGCRFCPTPAREADLPHLLWTRTSLQAARLRHLSRVGVHPNRPPDFQRRTHDPHHRSFLNFFEEIGLYLYI